MGEAPVTAGPQKLITVIVPGGTGLGLIEWLHAQGVTTASFGSARAPLSTVRRQGGLARTVTYSVEKDVVTVLVEEGHAGPLFEALYHRAGIGAAHGGFMFQASIPKASPFVLPSGLPTA